MDLCNIMDIIYIDINICCFFLLIECFVFLVYIINKVYLKKFELDED